MKAQIMSIGNVTPDSFFGSSRLMEADSDRVDGSVVVEWARQSLSEGASILDIGGCSTRPNSSPASSEEEWRRVCPALEALREAVPDAQLSLDTFRPEIARKAIEMFGPLIINDVSGGCEQMYALARDTRVPYILTLRGGSVPQDLTTRMEGIQLILDPGLGFTGGVESDYAALRQLDDLRGLGYPILVGLSRKSMVYRPLGLTPETCATATQVLHLYALQHGATILRTHDVALTNQTISLWERLQVTS